MKARVTLALVAFCVAAGALTAGCSSDNGNSAPPTSNPDAGIDGGNPDGGSQEFTAFVKQLIENDTRDNNRPTTITDKKFVDSMDPKAFPPSFFP